MNDDPQRIIPSMQRQRKYVDVFLVVRRRKKTTVFLNAKESTSVHELKKMSAGFTKVARENQTPYVDEQRMYYRKPFMECGFSSSPGMAQA